MTSPTDRAALVRDVEAVASECEFGDYDDNIAAGRLREAAALLAADGERLAKALAALDRPARDDENGLSLAWHRSIEARRILTGKEDPR